MTSDRAAIADRLQHTRSRTRALYAPLADVDVGRAPDPIMSPPVWDLGHIAAYEELWVACRVGGEHSQHPDLQRAYDAFETPRATRAAIRLLDRVGCERWLDDVRERTLSVLDRADLGDDTDPLTRDGFVFDMVAQHEAQHTETVLQALQMFDDGTYRPSAALAPPAVGDVRRARIEVPGGHFEVGAGDRGFAYDCERPRHGRRLEPFAIDRLPVTNGDHLAFMADGGYERAELWSAEGWAWRAQTQVVAPLYWYRDGGEWMTRTFDDHRPVDPMLPVCHVSFWEAQAHASWAGARLPTEAEWERAAAGAGGFALTAANLGQHVFAPAPAGSYEAGASECGCLQMIGDVWEWTSDRFDAYPGFRMFPYPEYAEVFFGGDYRVLRGGSWATQPIAARTTFRNWDHPQRRQIFAGVRLAWDRL